MRLLQRGGSDSGHYSGALTADRALTADIRMRPANVSSYRALRTFFSKALLVPSYSPCCRRLSSSRRACSSCETPPSILRQHPAIHSRRQRGLYLLCATAWFPSSTQQH